MNAGTTNKNHATLMYMLTIGVGVLYCWFISSS